LADFSLAPWNAGSVTLAGILSYLGLLPHHLTQETALHSNNRTNNFEEGSVKQFLILFRERGEKIRAETENRQRISECG
jgi:hypothetical protein